MKEQRNSSVELLRIISMIMIIAHHYVLYGVQQHYDENIVNMVYIQGSYINKFIAQFLLPGGVVGVNIFFIIMGYFGIKSDKIKLARVVNKTLIYSINGLIIYVILGFLNIIKITDLKQSVLECFFPFCNSTYWFISVYIIITIMKDLINQIANKLSSNKRVVLLILLGLVYFMLARYSLALYLGLIQGIIFYIIGALVKLNEDKISNGLLMWLTLGMFGWGLYVILNNSQIIGLSRISGYASLVGITFGGTLSAVAFSIAFIKRKKIFDNRINFVAASSLPVYLIHEHPLLRVVLWSKILRVETLQWNSSLFIVYALFSVLIIYIVGLIANIFVNKLIERPFDIMERKFLESFMLGE